MKYRLVAEVREGSDVILRYGPWQTLDTGGAGPERVAHTILVAHGVEEDGPTVTRDSAAHHD
jgi:hypothetical protein